MILASEEVTQTIDGPARQRFVKELVRVDGPQPLSIVRKRLPDDLAPRGGYLAPVLLTHGFGQNRYAWHLSGRSFVNHLAAEGFDVYNVDLRGHGRSRRFGARSTHGVDEYIREDLPAAFAEVRALSGCARAFVVGHSLGGLTACAAAEELGDAVAGVATVGMPYRFTRGSASLAVIAGALRALERVGVIAPGPARLPVKWVGRWMHAWRAAWDNRYLPIPVRAWAPGTLEPELLREYLLKSFDSASIGTLIQLARIALKGEFRSLDGATDYGAGFEACDVPLLVVAGSHDALAPPASVRPAYERSRSTDKSYHVVAAGHGDLLLGRDAPRTTWPLVVDWLRARAHRAVAPGRTLASP